MRLLGQFKPFIFLRKDFAPTKKHKKPQKVPKAQKAQKAQRCN